MFTGGYFRGKIFEIYPLLVSNSLYSILMSC